MVHLIILLARMRGHVEIIIFFLDFFCFTVLMGVHGLKARMWTQDMDTTWTHGYVVFPKIKDLAH